MNQFHRWVSRHKGISVFLFSTLLCVVYTVLLLWLYAPVWLMVILDLFLVFATYCYVSFCDFKLLKSASDALSHHCDPDPLLRECEEQLSRAKNGIQEQSLQINACVAKVNLGAYQEVYDILSTLNIDKYPGMSPATKVIYYNNLSDVCIRMGNDEQAELWYQKSILLFADLRESKMKRQLQYDMDMARVEAHCRKKEYDTALQALGSLSHDTLLKKVTATFHYAKIYLAQNNIEKVRENLQYVITYGNKLDLVTLAKELYSQL